MHEERRGSNWTKREKWKREHRGSGEYERRGSAEEYWDSEEYEHWGSTRGVGRAGRREVRILSGMKSTPTGRGQLTVSEGYGR